MDVDDKLRRQSQFCNSFSTKAANLFSLNITAARKIFHSKSLYSIVHTIERCENQLEKEGTLKKKTGQRLFRKIDPEKVKLYFTDIYYVNMRELFIRPEVRGQKIYEKIQGRKYHL